MFLYKLVTAAVLLTSSSLPAATSTSLHWGTFKDEGCITWYTHRYSAVLWGIPWGDSWEEACESMPATVQGQSFDRPDNCVSNGINIWGEFNVDDAECFDPGWP